MVMAFGKDAETENVSDEAGLLGIRLGFVNLSFNRVHRSDHHVLPSIQFRGLFCTWIIAIHACR
jgi:hypothetical protein